MSLSSTIFSYAISSLPRQHKEQLTVLERFLQRLDAIVTGQNPDRVELKELIAAYKKATQGVQIDNEVVRDFVLVSQQKNIPTQLVEELLQTRTKELEGFHAETMEDLHEYLFGSAEVIALLVGGILHSSDKQVASLRKMAKALKYFDCLNSIQSAVTLERQYIPDSVLRRFKLKDVSLPEGKRQQQVVNKLIRQELERIDVWHSEALAGLSAFPLAQRKSLKIVSDLLKWACNKLSKNPELVFSQRIQPSFWRIVAVVTIRRIV